MINSWKKDKLLTGFSNHFLNEVNATLPYYSLLMYTWIIAHQHKNILEVGIAEGYSSYYFAYAAKMNEGMYYGIDNNPGCCKKVDEELTKADFPHKIICADTKRMKEIDLQ